MEDPTPYNPLTKKNLAASIVSRLLHQGPQKLPPRNFVGAGVYLIYYTGDFDAYKLVSNANRNGRFAQPIYVGKAVPAGARKGGKGLDTPHGNALFKRLAEHAESIAAVRNLKLSDFTCRWLVVDEVFIPLGEAMLISHYKPVWNLVVDGFGNHPPGGGRGKGRKPIWDVIHPGRRWAEKLSAAVTADGVLSLVEEHFKNVPIPPGETRDLGPLHPLTRREQPDTQLNWRVEKMKLTRDKTALVYNDFLTLEGIPPETYEYRLGNRSALEWVIDQYQVSTDKRSGITNDPNRPDDPQYIVRLIAQVITVSLETMKIVKSLPPMQPH